MSPKTHLFLLLALFLLPSSTQADEELLEDEDCVMKTSIVLRKLNECSSPSSSPVAATPMNARLLENMVEDPEKIIRKLLETQNQATMAQFVQLSNNMEEAENTEKSNRDQQGKQIQAITAQLGKISNKLEQMEQTLSDIAGKLEETKQTQVQENEIANKFIPIDCKRLLQWSGVNKMNFFIADGKHIYANNTEVTWYKTREWCEERGMQLATLKTLPQGEAVSKELKNRGFDDYSFWLSGSNIGQLPRYFQWADGTPVDNIMWYSGQPNDFGAGKETCVHLDTGINKLGDSHCSDTWRILCQVPTALSSCVS